MENNTQHTDSKNTPNWKQVQEKAFYKVGRNGQQIREIKQIELAVGWENISENGTKYISWSDSVIPVLPDVDGRIVMRSFEIKSNN